MNSSALPPQCISSTELVFRDGRHEPQQDESPPSQTPSLFSALLLLFILLFLADAFLRTPPCLVCDVLHAVPPFLLCSSWETSLRAGILGGRHIVWVPCIRTVYIMS
ncbi:hypothetical protein PFLUV_G00160170 [Perca fluviatilis]|uniref:Uncharacterized protein n=1 Tax=Perca fluviatilis TaxID=8168 RepID=A0A6A5EM20_PERFL|nr:hypothetical protein PFLUV_G00160170 [Perca fluviatilis]